MKQSKQRNFYLYDNGATCNLFCNEDLLCDLHDTQPARIDGIGNAYVTRRGMSLFGPAYVLTSLPFNITAEQEVIDKDRVTFDSAKSPHYYDNDVKWGRQENGLLTCDHTQAMRMVANNRVKQNVLTTDGHRNAYTTRFIMALDALPDGTYYNAQHTTATRSSSQTHS